MLRGVRTQRAVADAPGGIKVSTLRAVEAGRIQRPSLRVALELVKALDLGSLEELLGPIPSRSYLDDLRHKDEQEP
jgi:Helix-turn-helix